jgi:hypothetical protein
MIISGAHVNDLWLPGRYDVLAWSCSDISFRRDYGRQSTYGLVQYPGHTIHEELEVLWPMQATEEMAEEVLRSGSIAGFRNGIQDQNQEELQTVGDQYLSLVLEHNVIVWHSPCCGVVLEGLQGLAESRAMVLACLLC